MTGFLGSLFLGLALVATGAALFATVAAVRFGDDGWLRAARRLLVALFVLISASSIMLLIALVDSDFRLAYVVSYTERALPTPYKLAAFWAGKEGSLLLWAWLLAAMNLIALWQRRHRSGKEESVFIGTLAGVSGFFAALILFAADPFTVRATAAADGHGLNPLLQDPGMVAHPPVLFLGYAAFTIPFAAVVAALVVGRSDHDWLTVTRRWILFAWLALGLGILLGAQWAYVELGWGGYWAWDPVENASLLPWLTSTALLHSAAGQQQRHTFKRWNVVLAAGTFVLCILATYLTRSGVVQSVHAFGGSLVSDLLFLGLMGTVILGTGALLIWRRRTLRSEHQLERLISKEGAFLATNVLLVLMAAITLLGTIFPLLSTLVIGEAVNVKAPFYNHAVLPLGLVLLGLMALGPVLVYGRDAASHLTRDLFVPVLVTMLASLVMTAVAIYRGWPFGATVWTLVGTSVAALTVSVMVLGLWRATRRRRAQSGDNWLSAIGHVLDVNHRRYGGQLAHLGMILLMIGILGSGLFGVDRDIQLNPGQHTKFGAYTLTVDGLEQVRRGNYTAVQANVTLTDEAGKSMQLHPQVRYYDKSEQPNTEVAWRSTLRQDVYVTLAGWESNGEVVALEARLNPLVAWLWIGGVVLSLGGLFCLLPRLAPKAVPASHTAPAMPAPLTRSTVQH